MRRDLWVVVPLLLVVIPAGKLWPADWQSEWKSTIASAKQEGKVVVGIPAQSDLRKELAAIFEPQFGIKMELFAARGPSNASRIVSEFNAGLHYFDVYIGGSGTYDAFPYDGMAEEFMPYVILPEVKDAKYWWGGHIYLQPATTVPAKKVAVAGQENPRTFGPCQAPVGLAPKRPVGESKPWLSLPYFSLFLPY